MREVDFNIGPPRFKLGDTVYLRRGKDVTPFKIVLLKWGISKPGIVSANAYQIKPCLPWCEESTYWKDKWITEEILMTKEEAVASRLMEDD